MKHAHSLACIENVGGVPYCRHLGVELSTTPETEKLRVESQRLKGGAGGAFIIVTRSGPRVAYFSGRMSGQPWVTQPERAATYATEPSAQYVANRFLVGAEVVQAVFHLSAPSNDNQTIIGLRRFMGLIEAGRYPFDAADIAAEEFPRGNLHGVRGISARVAKTYQIAPKALTIKLHTVSPGGKAQRLVHSFGPL